MFSIRVKGLSKLIRDLTKTRKELPRRTGKFIDSLGEEILNLAKKEIGLGTRISKMMEIRKARIVAGGVKASLGWTANYGKILEFGAKKKVWTIKPKSKKALKFTAGGKTYFATKIVRHWNANSLRRHFRPAIEKAMKNISEKAKKIIVE